MPFPLRPAARGFTMVELMAVVVIIGVLAMIAMPNLTDALTAQRLRASGTDLQTSLLLARSQAIRLNGQVSVQPRNAGDWTSGWTVTAVASGNQFDAKDALGDRVVVEDAPASIVYERHGRVTLGGITRITLRDANGAVPSRCLVIDPGGQPLLTLGSSAGCA